MTVDIRRLAYFVAVVEHGSVSGAAAALRVAQPSLSQSIRALERELGVTLFERQHRGLTLTADGKALLDPARRVLDDADAARAAVRGPDLSTLGVLNLAVHDVLALDLTEALADFRRARPDMAVRLFAPSDEDDLVRVLVEGHCEVGLTYLPVRHPDLRSRPLRTRSVSLALPASGAAYPDPLPLAALSGMTVVDTLKEFSAARTAIRAALVAHGVVMRPAVRSAHREAIVPLVLGGAGVAFVSDRYAQEAAAAGAVVRRLDPPIDITFGLLFREGGLSPAARLLVDLMVRGH
ncbi:DNA-binding transcriptional LysR family regulator [Asanoa ferruginea]|uniref:DNA-binding transcriptional LysR family regulator n=1 Tax=Asanoa ferruginea TaxID=53367 RepID=A0A3D9ZX92_9ACTN|nr:LysR family transcriptional regulator [Asanoa ferruginea]REG01776.1 DNA-binding transcriptional LysR family regulator [Asanoa ferruginea]GIF49191.1 LysR family transcriptional regulator [Asanoa ferruginea]